MMDINKAIPCGTTAATNVITKNSDGSEPSIEKPKVKQLPHRGLKLPKKMKKGFDILKHLKDFKGHVFKFLRPQERVCLVCGKLLKYNNEKQMLKYCCKQCRRLRHNRSPYSKGLKK